MNVVSFAFFTITIATLSLAFPAYSQELPNSDKNAFYEPAQADKLITVLTPRTNVDKTLDNRTTFFSGGGNCPDEINIGSVTDDSTVFGGVDNNVFIDGSIIIQCN